VATHPFLGLKAQDDRLFCRRRRCQQTVRSIEGLSASDSLKQPFTRNSAEEPADLLAGSVRHLVMHEVSCRDETHLQIGKELRESVGPGSRQDWVMLAPQDPRCNADRRWGWRDAVDDRHTAGMVAQVPVWDSKHFC